MCIVVRDSAARVHKLPPPVNAVPEPAHHLAAPGNKSLPLQRCFSFMEITRGARNGNDGCEVGDEYVGRYLPSERELLAYF